MSLNAGLVQLLRCGGIGSLGGRCRHRAILPFLWRVSRPFHFGDRKRHLYGFGRPALNLGLRRLSAIQSNRTCADKQ